MHNNAIQENWKFENREERRKHLTLGLFSSVVCLQVWNMMYKEHKSSHRCTRHWFDGVLRLWRAHGNCVKEATKSHIELLLIISLVYFLSPHFLWLVTWWSWQDENMLPTDRGVWQCKGWWWWGLEVTLYHFLSPSHKIPLSSPFTCSLSI